MRGIAFLLVLMLLAPAAVLGQEQYPSRLIRLVVPFTGGGAADIVCRLLADRLMPILKQPIVVENRPGGGGMVGMLAVVAAPADGYTLLFVTDGSLVTGPLLDKKSSFDPLASFAPVSLVSSMAGLIAQAKTSPGSTRYVTTGQGTSTWIGAELFKSQLRVEMQEVRTRTWSEAVQTLSGGRADMVFATSVLLDAPVREGKLRPLAVMGHAPLPHFPGVAATKDLAMPGLAMYAWTGLVAPAGTPPAIVEKLNGAVRTVLGETETKQTFGKYGLAAEGTPSEWFRDFIRAEAERWKPVLAPLAK